MRHTKLDRVLRDQRGSARRVERRRDQTRPLALDGGVRRGSDIVMARCLGARAVLVGRAYAYGLAADGEAGVARVLALLRDGTDRTLGLLGCRSMDELGPGHVRMRPRVDVNVYEPEHRDMKVGLRRTAT